MKNTIRCLQAKDLKSMISKDNQEPLVSLENRGVTCRLGRQGSFYPSTILVPETVAVKLQDIQIKLQASHSCWQRVVVEGYRHPYIQESDFLLQFSKLARQFPEMQMYRLVLHDLMLEAGFAPFYGEWGRFSYGDRE